MEQHVTVKAMRIAIAGRKSGTDAFDLRRRKPLREILSRISQVKQSLPPVPITLFLEDEPGFDEFAQKPVPGSAW